MRFAGKSSRRRMDRLNLSLASMIDVTFLLLVYFMVTTVLTAPEDRLAPALKSAEASGAGVQADFSPQVIEVKMIDGAPAYRVGSRIVSQREVLEEVLSDLPLEPGVFIEVSKGVSVGFAIAALQVARDVGFEKVTYVPAHD